ncbi:hypothetical protein DPEC_G00246430 [Dallia pectoralis]|uniref:Uncharacterized protein n=1 Tax=Dallia pectoralis TaxID=75939 RepID=A0ACC2FW88_DALPE|nr:hypothetical protein DPEC_G00246430 [Dallia pectoralis]
MFAKEEERPKPADTIVAQNCVVGAVLWRTEEEEKELSVASVQNHVRRCHRIWHRARATLLRASDHYQHLDSNLIRDFNRQRQEQWVGRLEAAVGGRVLSRRLRRDQAGRSYVL